MKSEYDPYTNKKAARLKAEAEKQKQELLNSENEASDEPKPLSGDGSGAESCSVSLKDAIQIIKNQEYLLKRSNELTQEAIKRCKNVVTIDGKNTKANSRFKNQRVKNTTDVLFYDDVYHVEL